MKSIVVEAPAKINLWLEVYDRDGSGYHGICTVMHSIGLHDTLVLTLTDGDIDFNVEYAPGYRGEIPYDKTNLAYRAALAFYSRVTEYAPYTEYGVSVRLIKRIPAAAGLGGGSSDAAAVLRGLNLLYGNPIPTIKLREAGRGLGADVPFCISGGTALATGIGDILAPCGEPPKCAYCIAVPGDRILTGEAYAALDRITYSREAPDKMLDALESGSPEAVGGALFNRFELITPGADRIKEVMLRHGALGALLSGSGPSVFGMFSRTENAEAAAAELESSGCSAFVC